MGLHHRDLTHDQFTGAHLKNLPVGSGNPGAAAPIVSARTAMVIASLALLVIAVANGIGH